MELGESERLMAPGGADGGEILITVRPEKIKFAEVEGPACRISATVIDVVYLGSMTQYIVEVATGEPLVVHRLNDEVRGRPVTVGDRVTLHWAAEHSFPIEQTREAGRSRGAPGEVVQAEGVEAAP
jgi:ABC-type Fe3+/spermidine/putrescine transport system ATPase subunit